ncbi:MAG: hypothetical protein JWM71_1073 [Solirubrobacteraceae bacterium]|nr:hypothetical protein [Solirubrobacteraceae bacterium]
MSIKGSSETWFRRALQAHAGAGVLLPAALELTRPLTLAESLTVTLVLARDGHSRFPRAAARWPTQLVDASPGLDVEDLAATSAALAALAEDYPARVTSALAVLEEQLRRHRHADALTALGAFDQHP